jgi:hypothetical protein
MKLAFTICSNNYLAYAKTLGDSLLKHNPGFTFIIALVDRKSPLINYDFFNSYEIIPIDDVGIRDFEGIWKKYDIVELNTAVKPCLFKYLFKRYPEAESAFYFDPDILIYQPLSQLESYFDSGDILLTPHTIKPIDSDLSVRLVPTDSTFLNYGVYNLGFIGLKNRKTNVEAMLNWWEKRTLEEGFIDACNGLFVDQLWINLVPIYFEGASIIKEMGYNVAPWNLHERGHIQGFNGSYTMPDHSILTFYHFSSYKFKRPEMMARSYNRFNFSDFPEIKPLYDQYHQLLLANKMEKLSLEPCYFERKRQEYLHVRELEEAKKNWGRKKLNKVVKAITPPVIWKALRKVVN